MCWMLQYAKRSQSRAGKQEDVDSSESEDDLMEDVDDVMNSVFGTDTYESECDGDTSVCEANSDTDSNTSDDNMEVDTTW